MPRDAAERKLVRIPLDVPITADLLVGADPIEGDAVDAELGNLTIEPVADVTSHPDYGDYQFVIYAMDESTQPLDRRRYLSTFDPHNPHHEV